MVIGMAVGIVCIVVGAVALARPAYADARVRVRRTR